MSERYAVGRQSHILYSDAITYSRKEGFLPFGILSISQEDLFAKQTCILHSKENTLCC